MRRILLFSIFLFMIASGLAYSQPELLETKIEEGITISHLLYSSGKSKMEALLFKPAGDGPFSALVMIHGHSQDCHLFKESGKGYARANYVVFAPSMLGYGRSKGYSDFGGSKTLTGLLDGIGYLKTLPYVDSTKIGIYGFSRGAHAGSLLITQTKDLKAGNTLAL